jgi:hydrogenase nickel incorporation protein HypA/HybF
MRLAVPALAGVEVDALRFALSAVAPGTPLEAAEVVIDEPPAHARCAGCGRDCEVREHGAACPHCGGWRLEVTDGGSMRVVDLVVE